MDDVFGKLSSSDYSVHCDEQGSGGLSYSVDSLGWLPSWIILIDTIRALPRRAFWEIFAGCAVLTSAFATESWCVAPPIDVVFNAEFDVLNPLFIAVLVGIILEGRIAVLHVSPPCASFSMALNRFVYCQLRSLEFPEGLPCLSHAQRQRVMLGNALCEVACRLCLAQKRACTLVDPSGN